MAQVIEPSSTSWIIPCNRFYRTKNQWWSVKNNKAYQPIWELKVTELRRNLVEIEINPSVIDGFPTPKVMQGLGLVVVISPIKALIDHLNSRWNGMPILSCDVTAMLCDWYSATLSNCYQADSDITTKHNEVWTMCVILFSVGVPLNHLTLR